VTLEVGQRALLFGVPPGGGTGADEGTWTVGVLRKAATPCSSVPMAAMIAATPVTAGHALVPELDPAPPPLRQKPWQAVAEVALTASEMVIKAKTTVATTRQTNTVTRRRLLLPAMVSMFDPMGA
jgi:hypothetical protein